MEVSDLWDPEDARLLILYLTIFLLAFYTAYSKSEKRIKIGQLFDVLFFQKGLNHTMKEFNKVIALDALGFFGYSLIYPSKKNILWTIFLIFAHAGISFVFKYQAQLKRMFGTNPKGWYSILIGQFAVTFLVYNWLDKNNMSLSTIMLLALLHFYLMERQPKKWMISVRPGGYVAIFMAIGALIHLHVYDLSPIAVTLKGLI